MAWQQLKRESTSADWVERVWPSPYSAPLRPQGPVPRAEERRAAPEASEPQSMSGTGEGLAPLRNAVLRLRRGHLKAAVAASPEAPRAKAPPRPRQLTLLDWRRGAAAAAPGAASAGPRPWWARINWALGFSALALLLAAWLILPELVASARDGFQALRGAQPPAEELAEGPEGGEAAALAGLPEAGGESSAAEEDAPPPASQEAAGEEADATTEAAPAAPAVEAPSAVAAAPAAAEPVPLLLAATHPDLALTSRSALVMGTGELYAWNADLSRPIAGLTKLMSAMVYLDTKPDLSEVITLHSADIQHGGPSARLAAGWKYRASDLLTAIVVGSENVAVEALIRSTGIGRDEFLIRMSEKALLLGMKDAAFYDPTGLSPANAASARDLALMMGAAARYPAIARDAARSQAEVVPVGRSTSVSFRNSNPLMSQESWRMGVGKGGFTDEAGYCVATTLKAGSLGEVTVILLGASGRQGAIRDAEQALDYVARHPRSSG